MFQCRDEELVHIGNKLEVRRESENSQVTENEKNGKEIRKFIELGLSADPKLLLFFFLLRCITSWSYVGINVWRSQGIA